MKNIISVFLFLILSTFPIYADKCTETIDVEGQVIVDLGIDGLKPLSGAVVRVDRDNKLGIDYATEYHGQSRTNKNGYYILFNLPNCGYYTAYAFSSKGDLVFNPEEFIMLDNSFNSDVMTVNITGFKVFRPIHYFW